MKYRTASNFLGVSSGAFSLLLVAIYKSPNRIMDSCRRVGYCDHFIILPIPIYFQSSPTTTIIITSLASVAKMMGTVCWLVTVTALLFQIMSWVSATSRSFAPGDYLIPSAPAPAPALQPGLGGNEIPLISPQAATSSIVKEDQNSTPLYDPPILKKDAEDTKDIASEIGSSPPSCDGKCYGCSPCKAIQVPTITSRVALQYANYEPEGWKCKCGPSFYSP